MAEPWISVDEVGKHVGVAKDSIYRRIGHRNRQASKIVHAYKLKLPEFDDVRTTGAKANDQLNSRRAR